MAVDMFIKIGDFEGESADKAHAKSIDVLAWSWGVSNSGTMHVGGGGGAGKANVQDLSLTKYVDASSSNLLGASIKGTHIPKATLIVRKAGEKAMEYIKIEMDSVIISSVSTVGSNGEDRLTENITLNFAKFKYTYKVQDDKGGPGADKVFGWNIKENCEQ